MCVRRRRVIYVLCLPLILAGIFLAGCAAGVPSADNDAVPAEGVELRVVNSRTQELDIYVVVGAVRERLGRVRAAGRETLVIPIRLQEGSGIALLAVPQGPGDPLVSRQIMIAPGDVIEWFLENNLALSRLNVRRRPAPHPSQREEETGGRVW